MIHNEMQEISESGRKLVQGRYRHYKGRDYVVLQWALHTETLEKLVIYYAPDTKLQVFARPIEMFLDDVVVDGKKIPRFELIEAYEF